MLPYTPSLYQFLYRYNGCTNGCTGIPLVWYNLKMCNISPKSELIRLDKSGPTVSQYHGGLLKGSLAKLALTDY